MYSGSIKERLDRVLVSSHWICLFSNAMVHHLDPTKSDYILIIFSMDEESAYRRKCRHGFHFKKVWASHEECESVIRETWNYPMAKVPMFQVVHRIKATRVALLKWQHVVFKGQHEEINGIRSKFDFILAQPLSNVALA
ncbi:hypothetical protein ACFX2C_032921 [Malus domestica]